MNKFLADAAEPATWESCSIDGVPTFKCLEVVFEKVLTVASSIALLVLFVMFIVGSFLYLTSQGNPEKVAKAKNTLTWAIAGLIIFLCSYLVIFIIDTLFLGGKGSLLKFEIPELPSP